MKAYVVDVNVAIVANGRDTHANELCIEKCIETLQEIKDNGIVVLDTELEILSEYRTYLSFSGSPGVGDMFFKWLWDNQAVVQKCERVTIHKLGNSYNEFPSDSALCSFDPSDRKYVAVARASAKKPSVLNAVDTDWWIFRNKLKACGVDIIFLCPQLMNAKDIG